MDELNNLYAILNQKGLVTKPFEEFQSQWEDPAYRDRVFSEVSSRNLYTKDRNSFDQKYASALKKKEPTTSPSPSVEENIALDEKPKDQPQSGASFASFGAEIADRAKTRRESMPDKRQAVYTNYPGKEGYEYQLNDGQWQFRKKLSPTTKMNVFDVFDSDESEYTPWQKITDEKRSRALDVQFLDGDTLERVASRRYAYTRSEAPEMRDIGRPEEESFEQPSPESYYITDFGQKDVFAGLKDFSQQSESARNTLAGLSLQKEKDIAAAQTDEQRAQVERQYEPLIKSATEKIEEIKNAEGQMREGFSRMMSQPDPTTYDKKKGILLGAITENLVGLDEEVVVPSMVSLFENAGPEFDIFDFEQFGAGDYLRVTNKRSGEKIEISLDNWSSGRDVLEANILKGFVRLSLSSGDYYDKVDAVEKLRKDIDGLESWDSLKKMELESELSQAVIDMNIAEKKRLDLASSEKYMSAAFLGTNKRNEISGQIFRVQEESDKLSAEMKEANKWYDAAAENYSKGNITEEQWKEKWEPEIDARTEEFRSRSQKLQAETKNIVRKQSTLDTIAGMRYVALEDRGNVFSGMSKSFTKGAVTAFEFLSGRDSPGFDDPRMERVSVDMRDWYLGITSDEYLRSENRSGIEKILFGISESIGSTAVGSLMMGGMPIGGLAGIYGISYRDMQQQLDEAGMGNIPDGEKFMISAIYGASIGMLERYGITKSFSKSPIGKKFVNWIIASTFKEIPKGASAEVIESYIKKNIMAAVEKGIIDLAGAGIVEGSTEGAQEVADATIKKVYNIAKDKEIFQEYETWSDFFAAVGESSAYGAIGGHMMHVAGGVGRVTRTGITNSGLLDFEKQMLFTAGADPEFKSILADNIKMKVANKEMTKQEGEEALQSFDEFVGVMRSVPPETAPENVQPVFDLLVEKKNLEREILGVAPDLVTEKTERIKAIEEELQTISNPERNAEEVGTETEVAGEQEVSEQQAEAEQVRVRDAEQVVPEPAKEAKPKAKVTEIGPGDVKAIDKQFRSLGEKTTVHERSALRNQIMLEARAAKEGAVSEKAARKVVAERIQDFTKGMNLNASQSQSILKKALTMNLSNPVMADQFVDYVGKVATDAQYATKLKEAYKLNKQVKSMAKSKLQQAEVRTDLKEFAQIDPRTVESIDDYLRIAELAKSAGRSTRKVPGGFLLRSTQALPEVAEFTTAALERQDGVQKDVFEMQYPDLFSQGVLTRDMSVNEIREIINSIGTDSGPAIKDESDVIARAREVYDSYAGVLSTMIETEVDPFTGAAINLSPAQKRGAKALLALDMDKVNGKTLFRLVDQIGTLVTNGFTGNIDAITSYVQGEQNADRFVEENGRAPKMSGALRNYDYYFASLPVMMDTVLRGTKRAISFMDQSGLSGIIQGSNTAKKNAQDTLAKYASEFYKKKPNGKAFNDPSNVYERGAVAFLSRNIMGTESEMQSEFSRRVRIFNETVEYLNSNRASGKEKKKGKHYATLQQKLGLLDEGIVFEDVLKKSDPANIRAAEWWVSKWGEVYDELNEVSRTVYNKELPSDVNYTPDRFKRREGAEQQDIADMLEGAFGEFNDSIYNKESSVLMESNKPNILPKNRYIDLDFDANNFSMIEAALIDSATAADIRKIQGFMKSDAFGDMFYAEDKKVVSERINNYILRVRKKEAARTDQAKIFKQITNTAARVGTTMALGGVDQIPKQTVSVAMNTLINSGRLDIGGVMSKEVNEWINNSGMPIASRGIQSEANIDVAEKNLDRMVSMGQKAYDKFAKLNDAWLKVFLSNPDRFVARASFLSYYKQNLRSRKISTDIDYSAPMDTEAANYAQHMVDRQQNISDSDLAGELFSSKSPSSDFLRKVFFPFSNFVMNQKTRMWSDVRTASSRTANEEDRITAFRSLAGLGAEMAIFHTVAMTLRSLYKEAAREFTDYDPERDDKDVNRAVEDENKARRLQGKDEMTKEEERVFRYEFVRDREYKRNKGTFFTSVFKDIFSPVPAVDDYMVQGFNAIAKSMQMTAAENSKEANEAVRIANLAREDSGKEKMNSLQEAKFRSQFASEEVFQLDLFEDKGMNWGVIGIAKDKWSQYGELSQAASEGTVTVETPGGDKEKFLTDKDKKSAEFAAWGMLMYNLNIAPADIGKESSYIFSMLKKKALTETQMEQYEALKKLRGGKEPSADEMARIRNGVKADEIEEIETGSGRVEAGRSGDGRVEAGRVEN